MNTIVKAVGGSMSIKLEGDQLTFIGYGRTISTAALQESNADIALKFSSALESTPVVGPESYKGLIEGVLAEIRKEATKGV